MKLVSYAQCVDYSFMYVDSYVKFHKSFQK